MVDFGVLVIFAHIVSIVIMVIFEVFARVVALGCTGNNSLEHKRCKKGHILDTVDTISQGTT